MFLVDLHVSKIYKELLKSIKNRKNLDFNVSYCRSVQVNIFSLYLELGNEHSRREIHIPLKSY